MRTRLLTLLLPLLALPAGPVAGMPWGWPLPAPHQVLRGFAPPGHDWLPGHRGVDLAADVGAVVRSAGAGVVAFAARIGDLGVVAVRHADGLETTYEPVRPTVRRGEHVALGAELGRLDAGGHCAVSCLHWGLRRGAAYLDPRSLVGAARVRLLPAPTAGGGVGPRLIAAAATAPAAAGGVLLWRRRRSAGARTAR